MHGDTLTCLYQAEAREDTERVLDEATHARAYDAWARARRDIFEEWQKATDPRNLQPHIPKAMREAAELLRAHPPAGLTQDQVDLLIEAIEAPYGARVLQAVRIAMRSSTDPAEQSAAVAAAAKRLGLTPSPAPQPLPVISIEDVHLVCWLAIVGQ